MNIIGIDIGGSGIKGAPVDLGAGRLLTERHKLLTPQPATPAAVAAAAAGLAREFPPAIRYGVAVPAVVKDGVAHTAANIDPEWVGCDIGRLFAVALGAPVTVLNDADAAGLAEMRFGAGRDEAGTVVMLTFGTGIGSALFLDGRLVPNTEFGHMEVNGAEAEHRAAAQLRKSQGLSWDKWAARVSEVLVALENLVWPDLFIVGGGVSRKADKFMPLLECRTRVVPAALGNDAGIVGAALAVAGD
ncbi:polyphosphate--glucose phosphotransferase [Thioalkalivibrio sp. XN8]|uniref:polyphosphate--glucose phosphotransferase n=1 Tax=Thioalkalivibrio sp. XN8 TaxID=2712863 RepID=UPI0013EE2D76|nr:ROK family protein [Thioalkalivibrio sp. XN8]NGP53034.1 ROK family protein [Thioalkalivibrio sp. XN8]